VLSTYEGVGRYRVHAGREIVVDALPGVEPAIIRHGLIGPDEPHYAALCAGIHSFAGGARR
jgi:hypothetical protein